MSDLTSKERFEELTKQIEREDTLYQSRSNFLVVLNVALAAAAVGLLSEEAYSIGFGVAVFGVMLNFTLNELLLDGKRQQHYLRTYYYEHFVETDFPRPFWTGSSESALQGPKKISRIVIVMLVGWTVYAAAALYILFSNQ